MEKDLILLSDERRSIKKHGERMPSKRQNLTGSSKGGERIVATVNDVLSGPRAGRFDKHPGNQRFKQIIRCNKDAYQNKSSKLMKTVMIDGVIKLIHEDGGRFLSLDEDTGAWAELSHRATTDKIGHALRFSRAKKRDQTRRREAQRKQDLLHRLSPSDTDSDNFDQPYEATDRFYQKEEEPEFLQESDDVGDQPFLSHPRRTEDRLPSTAHERHLSSPHSMSRSSASRAAARHGASRAPTGPRSPALSSHAHEVLKKIAHREIDGDDDFVYKRLRLLYDMRLLVSLTRILNEMDMREMDDSNGWESSS